MRIISQMTFSISEMTAPSHGELPWKNLPMVLILRTTNKGTSRFDNRLAYTGRDNKEYVLAINFVTTNIESTTGTLNPKNVTNLSSMPLEPLGDGYFSATWLNVVLPGSGLCRVIITGHAEG